MGDAQLYPDDFCDEDDIEVYAFSPIAPDEIRLLVLEPGRGEEPLSCTLRAHRLADKPRYEAISYPWGEIDLCHEIWCDGRPLSITRRLRDVLRQCRLPDRYRVLWVDFVCINQLDVREKARQVASMSKIYTQSERVLICFGPDRTGGCAQEACSWLYRFNQFFESTVRGIRGRYNAFPFLGRRDPLSRDPRWSSVAALAGQPWFERGWVVPEVSLAKDALICWGNARIDWLWVLRSITWALRRSISVYCSFNLPEWELHMMMYTSRYKDEAITMWPWGGLVENTFLDALDLARLFDYNDERDRVYSILSLPVAERIRGSFSIDYSNTRTVSQVFKHFACRYLDRTHDLMLLHYTENTEATFSLNHPCPSWVPQWLSSANRRGPNLTRFDKIISRESPILPWVCVREGDNILRVRGVMMDSIALVSSLLTDPMSVNAMASVWWQRVRYIKSTYHGFPPIYAFFRALFSRSPPTNLTPEQIEAAADVLVQRLEACGRGGDAGAASDAAEDDLNTAVGLLWDHIQKLVHDRRVAVTVRGYYCLVPGVTRVKDSCAVIFGTATPFILRGTEGLNHYKLVGDAFMTSTQAVDMAAGDTLPYRVGRGYDANEDWLNWGLREQDIWLC